jgi:hypothetical protein
MNPLQSAIPSDGFPTNDDHHHDRGDRDHADEAVEYLRLGLLALVIVAILTAGGKVSRSSSNCSSRFSPMATCSTNGLVNGNTP